MVTTVHKANVLRKSDGLFLACCRRVAQEYPALKYEEALVDSLAMRMVLDPGQFQVIVTTNLFGDILYDLAAGLIGGLGLCPSANLGPVHGSAPDIAGKGLANPTAAILCGVMLLKHLGKVAAADRVERAMEHCLAAHETTGDLRRPAIHRLGRQRGHQAFVGEGGHFRHDKGPSQGKVAGAGHPVFAGGAAGGLRPWQPGRRW